MKVIIFGAGDLGRVVLDIFQRTVGVTVVGFLDGNAQLHGTWVDGVLVMGDISLVPSLMSDEGVSGGVVAIGANRARASVARQLVDMGLPLANAIHPRATVAKTARLGRGVVVAAGAVVNPDASVGDNVIINTGAIVEHGNVISDHVNLAPGTVLAGRVTVKSGAFLGIRAAVIPGITIGCWTMVAAGSVVTKDLPDDVFAGGVPARVIRHNQHTEVRTAL